MVGMEEVMYGFVSIAVTVISFFLVRFYYLVDEMRKDVKQLLIRESAKNQAMQDIKEDLEDIKSTVHDHDKKLNRLEIDLAKLS